MAKKKSKKSAKKKSKKSTKRKTLPSLFDPLPNPTSPAVLAAADEAVKDIIGASEEEVDRFFEELAEPTSEELQDILKQEQPKKPWWKFW